MEKGESQILGIDLAKVDYMGELRMRGVRRVGFEI